MDSYNYFCNKQDEKNNHTEKAQDYFFDYIADSIADLQDSLNDLERVAKNFEHDGVEYDFTEDLRDYLTDEVFYINTLALREKIKTLQNMVKESRC